MKNICLYILLLFNVGAYGQIVLYATDYPTILVGRDSIKLTVDGSSFPSVAAASGGNWDFSTLTDSVPVFFDYRVPTAICSYADSDDHSILGFNYIGKMPSCISPTAILQYGINNDSIAYSISALTISASDSLFIPAQSASYSTPATYLSFPATVGSNWFSTYSYNTHYRLFTALPAYNHAPGYVTTHVVERSIVVGWGQARINNALGGPTPYFDVLQIQTRTIKQDSFFLDGGEMPWTLLTLFQMTQGQTDTVYEERYIRRGEITPLISITCRDAAYTQPIRARKHVGRLYPYVDAVADIKNIALAISPNPVTGQEITMQAAKGSYDYQLTNILGQVICSGTVIVKGNTGKIPIADAVMNGCYYLRISGVADSQTIPLQISR